MNRPNYILAAAIKRSIFLYLHEMLDVQHQNYIIHEALYSYF